MSGTVKLASGNSLHTYISKVVSESLKSALAQKALTEKEKQDAAATNLGGGDESSEGGDDDFFGGSAEDDSAPEDTSSKTMDDESEKLEKGDIEPKDIVEKLNSIRSGKSFKDSAVANSMEEYINSLSKAERVALMAFLKGISQIVTGEVPAQNVADPSDTPSDVQMQKGEPKKVKHVQPNVIKSKKPSGGESAGGGLEDTSAPAPITPKKR